MERKVTTYEVSDGVALVTLNRPDRLNAWTARMEAEVNRRSFTTLQEAVPSSSPYYVSGAGLAKVTLDDAMLPGGGTPVDVLALDEALTRLAGLDPTQAKVVELRYFVGLSAEEVAEVLKVSVATVMRDWSMARSWLRKEVGREP